MKFYFHRKILLIFSLIFKTSSPQKEKQNNIARNLDISHMLLK